MNVDIFEGFFSQKFEINMKYLWVFISIYVSHIYTVPAIRIIFSKALREEWIIDIMYSQKHIDITPQCPLDKGLFKHLCHPGIGDAILAAVVIRVNKAYAESQKIHPLTI